VSSERRYRVVPGAGIELLAASYQSQRFVPHAHDYAVLAITESGEAAGIDPNGGVRFGPGAVLLIPPQVVHAAHSVGSDPWQYRAFYLAAPRFERVRTALGHADTVAHTVVHHAPVLAGRLRELHHDLESDTDDRVASALDEVIEDLAPLMQRAYPRDGAQARVSAAVQRAKAMIDAAPERRWSLQMLSQASGASPYHLCRAFGRQVGASPYAYALQRRVSAARDRLRGPKTISRVAHELGFADQSHFTRLFLRVFGLTPGEYRAALAAQPH
jgi:AraC-like DNA-binding protein